MIKTRTSPVVSKEETAIAEKFFFTDHPEYNTDENSEAIIKYVVDTWKVELSDESLAVAVQQLQQQLKPLSAAQVELQRVGPQFSQQWRDAFDSWFIKQTILENGNNPQGWSNLVTLMKEIGPAREFTPQRAEEAIGRVAFSGRGQLFYKQAPKPSTPPATRLGKPNHAASADLEHKPKADGPRFVGGRLNHASVQQEKKSEVPSAPADSWASICEKLTRNGTHGQQNRLRQILDGAIADGKSYREAHSLLQTELARLQRG